MFQFKSIDVVALVGFIELVCFIDISQPKLDLKFSIVSLINSFHCLVSNMFYDVITIQDVERPNGIWKNHYRHIGVQRDPNMPIMVLPDTTWSFHVLNRVPYLSQSEAPKKVHGITCFLRVYAITTD